MWHQDTSTPAQAQAAEDTPAARTTAVEEAATEAEEEASKQTVLTKE